MPTNLHRFLRALQGDASANHLFSLVDVELGVLREPAEAVSRAELAQALNMLLFDDLLQRVPAGKAYVADALASGRKIVFDHGAVRTVKWPSGGLPPGEAALTRVLRPLGYRMSGHYPLERLKMTGRSWAHEDFPDTIAQFFVSELHPERFSPAFQVAVGRVLASSQDPLQPHHVALLEQLERDKALPHREALALMPALLQSFGRQHGLVDWQDYETLLSESAEMAWISTEGNAFNHVTDRVPDLQALTVEQKALGRPIKEAVEVSRSGRVKQTAFRAAEVERPFRLGSEIVHRRVPGSFYEFICRDHAVDGSGARRLDLTFDAGNATAIFAMTAAAA